MANERTATAEKTAAPIPMVVPVRSNKGNVSIPYDNGKTGEERVTVGSLHLLAGPNLVPLSTWEACKRNPSTGALLESRIPFMVAAEQDKRLVGRCVLEEGKPVPASAPLAAMDESAAVAMVADMLDANLLTQLQGLEHRVAVRKAIEARIASIKDPTKGQATAAEAAAGMGRATISMT